MFHLGNVPRLQQKQREYGEEGVRGELISTLASMYWKNSSKSCYNNESLIEAQGRDRIISDVQEMYVWRAARRESRQMVHRTQGYVFL